MQLGPWDTWLWGSRKNPSWGNFGCATITFLSLLPMPLRPHMSIFSFNCGRRRRQTAGNSIEMAQASTLTFRVMACPSHLSCHLLPIHREPKGNAVLLPTVLASPPWGTANQEETRHLPKEKEASIWVLTPNSCKAMGKYQRLAFLQISAEH